MVKKYGEFKFHDHKFFNGGSPRSESSTQIFFTTINSEF